MNRLLNFQKSIKLFCNLQSRSLSCSSFMFSGGDELGRGAGKGGGAGGPIREAGGSFGKREAALEEEYFRKLSQRQLKELKENLEEEVDTHAKEIQKHEDAIKRHKRKVDEIKNLIKTKDT